MRLTTEKSVETNVLRHLVNCLEERTGNKITIISPTQNFEEFVGYDDILHGLPPGEVIALQFKRPLQEDGYVKFILDVPQMKKMNELFPHNAAFYAFPPFPTHLELINAYDRILNDSLAIDVHNVADIVVTNQKTSEVRFFPHQDWQISDNREFNDLNNLFPLENFCRDFSTGKIGTNTKYLDEKFYKSYQEYMEKNPQEGLEIFFLHMA